MNDLMQFYGVAGAPLIEAIVEYLKSSWRLPTQAAPLAAIIVSIGWNLLLGVLFFHSSVQLAVASGLLTAITASGWHVVTS